jgi:hypothetical protein
VLVGPLPVRKCHKISSRGHMQLGWVVRWVLSTPPGPPHGWAAAVSCQYFPCSFVLALRELGLRLRINAPSRSALAPVESSPGPVLLPVTVLQFQHKVSCRSSRQIGIRLLRMWCCAVVEPRDALWSRRCTLIHVTYFTSRKSCATGAFVWLPHRTSNHNPPLRSRKARRILASHNSTKKNIRDGRISDFRHSGMICDLGACVICFLSP